MKTTIFSIVLFTTMAFASADQNVLKVSNVTREGGKTTVSFSRDISTYNVYTDSYQTYQLGAFTKTFVGTLGDAQIVEKASRYVDDFIIVQSGSFKAVGRNQNLASLRSKAFFASGYDGYFTELAKQLADEK